jgi:hypothetical protein
MENPASAKPLHLRILAVNVFLSISYYATCFSPSLFITLT